MDMETTKSASGLRGHLHVLKLANAIPLGGDRAGLITLEIRLNLHQSAGTLIAGVPVAPGWDRLQRPVASLRNVQITLLPTTIKVSPRGRLGGDIK